MNRVNFGQKKKDSINLLLTEKSDFIASWTCMGGFIMEPYFSTPLPPPPPFTPCLRMFYTHLSFFWVVEARIFMIYVCRVRLPLPKNVDKQEHAVKDTNLSFSRQYFGSISVSGQLPIYPSPNPTTVD